MQNSAPLAHLAIRSRDLRGMTEDSDPLTGHRTCRFAALYVTGPRPGFACGMSGVTGWKAGGRLRPARQQKLPICGMFSAGATGLEPATSGVTGRSWRLRAERG
jgi:hypothetical protein